MPDEEIDVCVPISDDDKAFQEIYYKLNELVAKQLNKACADLGWRQGPIDFLSKDFGIKKMGNYQFRVRVNKVPFFSENNELKYYFIFLINVNKFTISDEWAKNLVTYLFSLIGNAAKDIASYGTSRNYTIYLAGIQQNKIKNKKNSQGKYYHNHHTPFIENNIFNINTKEGISQRHRLEIQINVLRRIANYFEKRVNKLEESINKKKYVDRNDQTKECNLFGIMKKEIKRLNELIIQLHKVIEDKEKDYRSIKKSWKQKQEFKKKERRDKNNTKKVNNINKTKTNISNPNISNNKQISNISTNIINKNKEYQGKKAFERIKHDFIKHRLNKNKNLIYEKELDINWLFSKIEKIPIEGFFPYSAEESYDKIRAEIVKLKAKR